jgi:hypothetical protein
MFFEQLLHIYNNKLCCLLFFSVACCSVISFQWSQVSAKIKPLFLVFCSLFFLALFAKILWPSSWPLTIYLQIPLMFLSFASIYCGCIYGFRTCFDAVVRKHYLAIATCPTFRLESLLFLLEIRLNEGILINNTFSFWETYSIGWLVIYLPLFQLISTSYTIILFLLILSKVYAWLSLLCVPMAVILIGVYLLAFSESWLQQFERMAGKDFLLCLGIYNLRSLFGLPFALSLSGFFQASIAGGLV